MSPATWGLKKLLEISIKYTCFYSNSLKVCIVLLRLETYDAGVIQILRRPGKQCWRRMSSLLYSRRRNIIWYEISEIMLVIMRLPIRFDASSSVVEETWSFAVSVWLVLIGCLESFFWDHVLPFWSINLCINKIIKSKSIEWNNALRLQRWK